MPLVRRERVELQPGARAMIVEYHRHQYTIARTEQSLGCSHKHGDGRSCDAIIFPQTNSGEGYAAYVYKETEGQSACRYGSLPSWWCCCTPCLAFGSGKS